MNSCKTGSQVRLNISHLPLDITTENKANSIAIFSEIPETSKILFCSYFNDNETGIILQTANLKSVKWCKVYTSRAKLGWCESQYLEVIE